MRKKQHLIFFMSWHGIKSNLEPQKDVCKTSSTTQIRVNQGKNDEKLSNLSSPTRKEADSDKVR